MVRPKKEETQSDRVAPVLVDLVAHSRLRAGFLAECEQVALCQVVTGRDSNAVPKSPTMLFNVPAFCVSPT